MLRWLKTVVVSVREKAHLMRQVGTRKTFQKRPVGQPAGRAPLRRRNNKMASKPEVFCAPSGMSLADTRLLARWCPA